MVFLGGAVLANLVSLVSFPLTPALLTLFSSDCRQGRHVGEQAGVGGTGCTRPGQARPAMNGFYLGGSWSAPFFSDFLLRIVCKPYCLGLFSLFSFPSLPPPSPHHCRYTPVHLVVSPVSSPASYIVPRLVWRGWIQGVHGRKERNISIGFSLYTSFVGYLRITMVGLMIMVAYSLSSTSV